MASFIFIMELFPIFPSLTLFTQLRFERLCFSWFHLHPNVKLHSRDMSRRTCVFLMNVDLLTKHFAASTSPFHIDSFDYPSICFSIVQRIPVANSLCCVFSRMGSATSKFSVQVLLCLIIFSTFFLAVFTPNSINYE